ncbi:MAG: hypothetical protein CMO04_06200 [Thalassospira sp.]|nr:hypothetical protein [Thalassospira sp.]
MFIFGAVDAQMRFHHEFRAKVKVSARSIGGKSNIGFNGSKIWLFCQHGHSMMFCGNAALQH